MRHSRQFDFYCLEFSFTSGDRGLLVFPICFQYPVVCEVQLINPKIPYYTVILFRFSHYLCLSLLTLGLSELLQPYKPNFERCATYTYKDNSLPLHRAGF